MEARPFLQSWPKPVLGSSIVTTEWTSGVLGCLALSTLAFPDETLADAVALGDQLGEDSIELRLIDGKLIEPSSICYSVRQRVRRVIRRLAVVGLDSSIRLSEEGATTAIVEFLQLANDLGAPPVRVFRGELDESTEVDRPRLDRVGRALELAVPVAERLGVAIGVETHDNFSSAALLAKVMSRLPTPWVGVVWDQPPYLPNG
jgi:sugar phosphate isomerase/epimerase